MHGNSVCVCVCVCWWWLWGVEDERWRENGRVGTRGHSCDIVGVRVWMQGRRRYRVRYVTHYLIGLCIVRFHV